jgi:hypothetical protein
MLVQSEDTDWVGSSASCANERPVRHLATADKIGSTGSGDLRNATLLLVNCCPHGEREEAFWCGVRQRLDRRGVRLVMYHTWQAVETTLPLVTRDRAAVKLAIPSSLGPYDRFQQRAGDWGRDVSQIEYRRIRDKLAETLCLTRPDFVVVWNGEQPSDQLLRPMLEAADCQYAIAERTPWPGMVSLDPRGILADCRFLSDSPHWDSSQQRAAALQLFEQYESHVRDSEVTWWQQPKSASLELTPPGDHLPILFAGQVDGDTQNFLFSPHFCKNLDAFSWFIDSVGEEPIWVLGKHHPWSETPIEEYRRTLGARAAQWRDDITIKQALAIVSGVVATNSSVLCEALIYRRPAFALGRTMIAGCGALEQLRDPADASQLLRWLESVRATGGRLTETQVADWCEFSAFHFHRHLYAMEGPQELLRQRGAEQMADEIYRRLSQSPAPNWSRLFDSREIVRYQQRLAKLRRARNQARPLVASRSQDGATASAACMPTPADRLEELEKRLTASALEHQADRQERHRQTERITAMLESLLEQQSLWRKEASESDRRVQQLESLWLVRAGQWWQSHIAKWIRSVAKRLPGRS